MHSTELFRDKLKRGQGCLGTAITFTDPTFTEAVCHALDFVWIDMEHNPLTLQTVQAHILATMGSQAAPLVRVVANDAALIKTVLDIGAAGVVVPLIRTVEEARRVLAACRYPPVGNCGFSPRRPSNYGRLGGPEFCRRENERVLALVQIEHIDAVRNLDGLLALPGLDGILIGPGDLSASMGLLPQTGHPAAVEVVESGIARARRSSVYAGIAIEEEPRALARWMRTGVQWLVAGADFRYLVRGVDDATTAIRAELNEASIGQAS